MSFADTTLTSLREFLGKAEFGLGTIFHSQVRAELRLIASKNIRMESGTKRMMALRHRRVKGLVFISVLMFQLRFGKTWVISCVPTGLLPRFGQSKACPSQTPTVRSDFNYRHLLTRTNRDGWMRDKTSHVQSPGDCARGLCRCSRNFRKAGARIIR
jgi:hypothetical protein